MRDLMLWGVPLSPFTLKLEAAFQFKGIAYRRLPEQGSRVENINLLLRLEAAKRLGEVTRYPAINQELDEYPLLPYVSYDARHFEYDSSSILHRMEAEGEGRSIIPQDSAIAFMSDFIDRAFNEFGLYLVHHMRWVASAESNTIGQQLADECKSLLPPGGAWLLARNFPVRQVKRLPYLFSVAPDFRKKPKRKHSKETNSRSLRFGRTPPTKQGFPATHELIEQSWKAILMALEDVLSEQNYLFGEHFSLADASVYGQLGMNLVDPQANEALRSLAPSTHAWLCRIDSGAFTRSSAKSLASTETVAGTETGTGTTIHPKLNGLLNILMGTFGALMVQNHHAFQAAQSKGQTRFNEAAFDRGEGLYTGKLRGYPFKTVIKTFQVRTWLELKAHWQSLSPKDQQCVAQHLHLTELLDSDRQAV